MRKILLTSAMCVASVGFFAGSGFAIPLDQLQNQLDMRVSDGSNDIKVATDMLSDSYDSYWKTTVTGVSGTTLSFKLGTYNPTISFGIYDTANKLNTLELFGAFSGQFAQASLFDTGGGSFTSFNLSTLTSKSATFSSEVFGYYMHVGVTGKTYYSDTLLNDDEFDHMLAYQGVGEDFSIKKDGNYKTWTDREYLLAWEDLPGGGDMNYTDYAVMVESVEPVPEPATMLLFGAGLAGLAGVRRRIKK